MTFWNKIFSLVTALFSLLATLLGIFFLFVATVKLDPRLLGVTLFLSPFYLITCTIYIDHVLEKNFEFSDLGKYFLNIHGPVYSCNWLWFAKDRSKVLHSALNTPLLEIKPAIRKKLIFLAKLHRVLYFLTLSCLVLFILAMLIELLIDVFTA
ncbi:MAG: hypothetical protein OQJ95_09905 [Kangiella sp.]|nr:hypothetical protein [Kangiella sp.]